MKSSFGLLLFVLFSIFGYGQPLSGQVVDTVAIERQVDSLIRVAVGLAGAGNFDQALSVVDQAEKLILRHFGRISEAFGMCIYTKGMVHYYSGNYAETEKWWLEVKEIRGKTIGKAHPDYAATLGNLGLLYKSMGQYTKAEGYLLECKEIEEKTIGKEDPDYAATLMGLGILYNLTGQYLKAEGYYLECKEIRGRTIGKAHPLYAATLKKLGSLYDDMGHYAEAEGYYLEGKAIREKTIGKEDPDYAATLNNIGTLYQRMGQYAKAEGYYLEGKEIFEKTIGKEDPEYASTLNNLGVLYSDMGHYAEAEGYYLECKAIREKTIGKEDPEYASTLNNLGILYNYMGQYAKAERYYLESKETYEKTIGKEHPDYAKTLMNLGTLYQNMGQYAKAEGYYLESKEIREKTIGIEHPDYATTLMNLGILYKNMGQSKAERYHLESKEIREKTIGIEHPDYATTLMNLGTLSGRMGQYTKAEGYLLKCKEIQEKTIGKAHPDYAITLNYLGISYWKMGQYDKALPLIDSTTQIQHNLLLSSVQFLSEKDLGDYLLRENGWLQFTPSYLHTGNYSLRMASIAYDDALFQKGFLQTAARRLNTLTSANPQADSLSRMLKSYRIQLSKEYLKPIKERVGVAELEEKANAVESQLAREVAGYAQAMQQVKWREVQAALKPGEAAVEFLQFTVRLPEETDTVRYAALLLRPGADAPLYVNLCAEREIDTLMHRGTARTAAYVDRLYQVGKRGLGLENNETIESIYQLRLYQLLWEPLEPHLNGIKTVYYANAGLLHRINLGAATINMDTVLADRYRLVELGSTRSLVVPDALRAANNNALVMGGINYDSDSTAISAALFALDTVSYATRSAVQFYKSSDTGPVAPWKPLSFASREADNISATLKQANMASLVFKGNNATEEAFYKSVRLGGSSPRIIHMATHGYFLPDPVASGAKSGESVFKLTEHPLIRSGLILAGGNHAWQTGDPIKPGMEDGILTAYEISQLNLMSTELVVLSACETGLGDIEGNEGVYGLQRSFKIAGAKYLIMSLWEIPDKESQIFMNKFYDRWLGQGLSIPDAFRRTQEELRGSGWTQYQWAGFVLVE